MPTSRQLIADPCFKTGFGLQGINPATDGRKVYKYLDYGQNKAHKDPIWLLTQWWTPFTLLEATEREMGLSYIYETASRRIAINRTSGEMAVTFDSYAEYLARYGSSRQKGHQPWSHLLIEQDFAEPAKVRDLVALVARLDCKIDNVESRDPEFFDPSIHAAQLLWYITIKEQSAEGQDGLGGNYIWFGVPIFDSRTKYCSAFSSIDGGTTGSTNKLIYSIDSRNYLPVPLPFGEYQHIEIDLLPFIKQAIGYAEEHKLLAVGKELIVNYMNFGWELPGSYRVSSSIKNMGLEAIIK